MPQLARETYLRAIEGDGRRLAASARSAGLDAPVPSCPEWAVRDLVAHTGEVFHHKGLVVGERLTTREAFLDRRDEWAPPAGDDVLDWYEQGLARFLDALRASDPTTPVWTWWPADQTVGFWDRRIAHETTVHRVDADLAAGDVAPVTPPELAADGVDEVLSVYIPSELEEIEERFDFHGETVHLHAHDAEGEWLVRLAPDGYELERGHVKGDTAVRGSASDLLLWLWGRVSLDALEVIGDVSLAHRMRELTRVGTQ